jgi:hypothetical protein
LNEDDKPESRTEESPSLYDSWSEPTPANDQSTDGGQASRTVVDGNNMLSSSAGGFAEFPSIPSQPTPSSMSTNMVVALTVAICLPPALLVGAIFGYLVAQRYF